MRRILMALLVGVAVAAQTAGAETLKMQDIAHRGMWDPKSLPQNSLEAIRLAYASGATWVESDFWHVKSGLMVCMHGPNELKSQTLSEKKIPDLTAEDLATLDLGAGARLGKTFRIPTLEQVLAVVPKENGVLQAEIKGYTPTYADVFVRAVAAAGLSARNIVVSSFDYAALKDFKARYPAYRAVWLVVLKKPPPGQTFDISSFIARCRAAKFDVFCPGCASTRGTMTPADADAVRAAGLEFRLYGVNSLADLRRAKELGAVGFTCNHWKEAFDWARQVEGVELLK